VAGSLNYDLVARVDHLPEPGEAVHASRMRPDLGGKGFNQAVAARRLGAYVELIGAIGDDSFGYRFVERLDELGIGRAHLARLPTSSGIAIPVVDAGGQNVIIVALGANLRLEPQTLTPEMFETAGILLVQGELRPETTLRAAKLGRTAGARVILNAAPAARELAPVMAEADIVVVNQVEARTLGGPEAILKTGAPALVITLGAEGAGLYRTAPLGAECHKQRAPRVDVIDTTGAGDAFCAALGVAIAEGHKLESALAWATAAGAAACMKPGTSGSMPERAEVDRLRRML
jgi:ribokinase